MEIAGIAGRHHHAWLKLVLFLSQLRASKIEGFI
jgi:hypothetical protein